jgi:hypothetical protein
MVPLEERRCGDSLTMLELILAPLLVAVLVETVAAAVVVMVMAAAAAAAATISTVAPAVAVVAAVAAVEFRCGPAIPFGCPKALTL